LIAPAALAQQITVYSSGNLAIGATKQLTAYVPLWSTLPTSVPVGPFTISLNEANFGAAIPQVFPNLANFPITDVGLMG
jgi:hypothetical protein